ncbi:MAG: hypothetical protein WAL32_06815 [Terriglobales bacterium]
MLKFALRSVLAILVLSFALLPPAAWARSGNKHHVQHHKAHHVKRHKAHRTGV